MSQALNGRKVADVFDVDATEQEAITQLIEEVGEIPIHRSSRPVFIGQGTADQVVFPRATEVTAQQLSAAGTDVTFRWYAGAGHDEVVKAGLPDILAWARARMR